MNIRWFEWTKGDSELVFDLGQSVCIAFYQLFTPSDYPDRDPVSWEVYYKRSQDAHWTLANTVRVCVCVCVWSLILPLSSSQPLNFSPQLSGTDRLL